MEEREQAPKLTGAHRALIGVVVAGAVVIAAIGFAGSYTAVRELALDKGFGTFSYFFPIGIDAGICVLLALDLLLTWMRIPFPMLRQTAWLLTAATIAFNGAAAWPDPLGVGMHAVIPVLFVVAVEAARHAIGRIADITADKHMEGVRITRWLLSPLPTFLLWRRMKLWELRSYEQVIKLEQERLVYQARLRSRFGRSWRRKAPVESLMPLRLARYGVPLAETAPAGLAAAGIEPALLPPAPAPARQELERADRPATETPPVPAPTEKPLPAPFEGTYEPHSHPRQAVQDSEAYGEHQPHVLQEPKLAEAAAADQQALLGEGAPSPASGDSPAAAIPPPRKDARRRAEAEEPEGARQAAPAPASRTAPGSPGRARTATTSSSSAADPVRSAPVPVTAQHVAPQPPQVSRQTVLDAPGADPVDRGHGAEPLWKSSAAEGGSVAARVPDPFSDDAAQDPVQQQIVTVARWLAEAEKAGKKLSGAEVARRLELSARTGQRRLDKAAAYLQEVRQKQSRAHLRPVRG
ncbi:DUF2637 domain-containing protein (plasmid) [Streptomyces sp. WA1-19]|uniref:DUF2637 domain-containing protein n=1 Tax=Streptomyces sp. WA1-19 TaxID=2884220 RepID=UPI001D03AA29|nr:DUF2637 domain-containing protein [Streptomyces sp. WA1-19]UDF11889.1 DUF2637 domain-containing protein [Streptomyces sp. WA1-19]